ncbi:cytochrome ubiquinol oxidase subunit I, partial [Pseudonocardia yunnanensis]
PRHNFTELPRIRSERPAFELHYPHLVERFREEAHAGNRPAVAEQITHEVAEEQQPDTDDPRSR